MTDLAAGEARVIRSGWERAGRCRCVLCVCVCVCVSVLHGKSDISSNTQTYASSCSLSSSSFLIPNPKQEFSWENDDSMFAKFGLFELLMDASANDRPSLEEQKPGARFEQFLIEDRGEHWRDRKPCTAFCSFDLDMNGTNIRFCMLTVMCSELLDGERYVIAACDKANGEPKLLLDYELNAFAERFYGGQEKRFESEGAFRWVMNCAGMADADPGHFLAFLLSYFSESTAHWFASQAWKSSRGVKRGHEPPGPVVRSACSILSR
jgi:hypothetical protein